MPKLIWYSCFVGIIFNSKQNLTSNFELWSSHRLIFISSRLFEFNRITSTVISLTISFPTKKIYTVHGYFPMHHLLQQYPENDTCKARNWIVFNSPTFPKK